MRRIKILFVAFSDSIHTARWISQLDRSKYEVHLFPSVPFREVHPLLDHITVWQLPQKKDEADRGLFFKNPSGVYNIVEGLTGESIAQRIVWRLKTWMEKALNTTIESLQPDIIHSMETQQGGYLVSKVIHSYKKADWIHSTWGIDFQYFLEYPEHEEQLKTLMSQIQVLIAEGDRDVKIARGLGFTKEAVIIPSVGGSPDFELFDKLDTLTPPSSRRNIILKGYEGYGRSASAALKAMRLIKPLLKNYEVIIYSCSKDLMPLVEEIQNGNEFKLKVVDDLQYQDILLMTAGSRISITNNLYDGVPNTMLEAMAFGTFPIQSNTAITEGWIEDGVNGILTIPTNEINIADAIAKALSDDVLIDKAADINRALVRKKLNGEIIKSEIDRIYSSLGVFGFNKWK